MMRFGSALDALEDAVLGHDTLVNGKVRSECPVCLQRCSPNDRPLSVKRAEQGAASFACDNGCEPRAIEASLKAEADRTRDTPPEAPRTRTSPDDTADPAAALGSLLKLPEDVRVVAGGCRIVGAGTVASADIALSNGETMTFERIADMAKHQHLRLAVVMAAGVDPRIKAGEALHAVKLLRDIAQRVESQTLDQEAAEWGMDILSRADVVDCDWTDQTQRWGAATRLASCRGEIESARREGRDLASACAVARHVDGTRYLRAGHVHEYVRSIFPQVGGAPAVNARMLRIGWTRPGTQGRIKATPPSGLNGSRPFSATYLVVPDGWEDTVHPADEAGADLALAGGEA